MLQKWQKSWDTSKTLQASERHVEYGTTPERPNKCGLFGGVDRRKSSAVVGRNLSSTVSHIVAPCYRCRTCSWSPTHTCVRPKQINQCCFLFKCSTYVGNIFNKFVFSFTLTLPKKQHVLQSHLCPFAQLQHPLGWIIMSIVAIFWYKAHLLWSSCRKGEQ